VTDPDAARTELEAWRDESPSVSAAFFFRRDARLFTRSQTWRGKLELAKTSVPLAPDQLFHPRVPTDAVIRLGKLRVSEFLEDGTEVTRAVLQAGATFRTRPLAAGAGAPLATGAHDLTRIVLTSLGESELWLLPAGFLAENSA
jgi:hypothetical protein